MTESDRHASPSAAGETRGTEPHLILRLQKLEHENGRLRRLVIGTLVATAVLLGVAAALVVTAAQHGMPGFVPDLVEAQEFILRDPSGRVRGVWGSDDQGAIRLVIQDHRTASSVKLNLLEDRSAGITIADSAGNARMVMAMLPDETASLVYTDRRGFTRTVLSLSPSGASTLLFVDDGGTARSGIGVDSRGRAMFTVQGLEEGGGGDSADSTREPAPEGRRRR